MVYWRIPRLNLLVLAEAVESLALVTAKLVLAGQIYREGCHVDGGAHHADGDEPIEGRSRGRVLMAEELHNDQQHDSLLVEAHNP